MKWKNSKSWTDPELEVLFEYYASHGPQFVSELLSAKGYNRSRRACGITGRLVGLEYKGPRMCFQPGNVPINKGRNRHRDMQSRRILVDQNCSTKRLGAKAPLTLGASQRTDPAWYARNFQGRQPEQHLPRQPGNHK